MDLGPHAAFIWLSYLAVAIAIGGLIGWLVLDARRYAQLLADLESRGVRFRSRSDTEVLVEGLNLFGLDLVPRLNGMFAFAWFRPADGQLTEKHARFLKQLNDAPELQSAVVERIRDERLSGDDTGNLVRALKKRFSHRLRRVTS